MAFRGPKGPLPLAGASGTHLFSGISQADETRAWCSTAPRNPSGTHPEPTHGGGIFGLLGHVLGPLGRLTRPRWSNKDPKAIQNRSKVDPKSALEPKSASGPVFWTYFDPVLVAIVAHLGAPNRSILATKAIWGNFLFKRARAWPLLARKHVPIGAQTPTTRRRGGGRGTFGDTSWPA